MLELITDHERGRERENTGLGGGANVQIPVVSYREGIGGANVHILSFSCRVVNTVSSPVRIRRRYRSGRQMVHEKCRGKNRIF